MCVAVCVAAYVAVCVAAQRVLQRACAVYKLPTISNRLQYVAVCVLQFVLQYL